MPVRVMRLQASEKGCEAGHGNGGGAGAWRRSRTDTDASRRLHAKCMRREYLVLVLRAAMEVVCRKKRSVVNRSFSFLNLNLNLELCYSWR